MKMGSDLLKPSCPALEQHEMPSFSVVPPPMPTQGERNQKSRREGRIVARDDWRKVFVVGVHQQLGRGAPGMRDESEVAR